MAFSEGFRIWIESVKKSEQPENAYILYTSQNFIKFSWLETGKLAYWEFPALDYGGYYTVSKYLDEYEILREECE